MAIKNAIIKSVILTKEDHGLLTAFIDLDYGGSGQGFGGYNLYVPKRKLKDAGNYAGHFIWRVLEIAGVEKWEDLRGKPIRVDGGHSGIKAIGHILEDEWFNPAEEFEEITKRFEDVEKK